MDLDLMRIHSREHRKFVRHFLSLHDKISFHFIDILLCLRDGDGFNNFYKRGKKKKKKKTLLDNIIIRLGYQIRDNIKSIKLGIEKYVLPLYPH